MLARMEIEKKALEMILEDRYVKPQTIAEGIGYGDKWHSSPYARFVFISRLVKPWGFYWSSNFWGALPEGDSRRTRTLPGAA